MDKRQPNEWRALPVKRYDLVQTNACYTTDHEMELCEDGEWVRYADVEHVLVQSVCDCDGGDQGEGLVSLPHQQGCAVFCDCIASGNVNKPKQHGADPHAKNCKVYTHDPLDQRRTGGIYSGE